MKKLWIAIGALLISVLAYAGWEADYSNETAPASGDLILIQDVSDTGDSAQGTTKNMTIDDLFDYVGRDISDIAYDNSETQTDITEAEIIENLYHTNQDASAPGELDKRLPDLSYFVRIIVYVSEAQIIEMCPPSGEIFDLDGTALDANDCIDSPATTGSKAVVTRAQQADATWQWEWDTVRGAFVDTGAGD